MPTPTQPASRDLPPASAAAAPPRRALATLFVIVFTDLIGFGIVIPLLPLYAEHYGPAPWVFGLLMASYSAMQFVSAPLLGVLSDRFGRRPVLLISLLGSVIGYLHFAAAHSLAMLFASRILAGIAGGNVSTAHAVIADITPPERRAQGMGLIGAAFGLGFIAGPAIAGLLVGIGPWAPGLGAACFSALAFVMAATLLPESLPRERRGRRTAATGIARLRAAARNPVLGRLLAVGFVVVSAVAMFEVTLAQFLHARLAISPRGVSFLFVYLGVLAAAVQGGIVGRLAGRVSERRLLITGLLLAAAGLALLALAPGLGWMIAAMPILALGQGLALPALSTSVSKSASAEAQGEALGAYQGAASLARVAGPFAGQMLLGTVGVASPSLAASGLALATAVALLLRPKR